jgi:hypothetical protein
MCEGPEASAFVAALMYSCQTAKLRVIVVIIEVPPHEERCELVAHGVDLEER